MKTRVSLAVVVLTALFLTGCFHQKQASNGYAEVPPMLSIVTLKAQVAVEQGVSQNGESAVLEAVGGMNSNVVDWFDEQGLELKIGTVADTAVVLVCDQGTPVYEDTYCQPGAPDRDHRGSGLESCEITMTEQDVLEICE